MPQILRGITLRPAYNGVPCERIAETAVGLFWELRFLWNALRTPTRRNMGSWVRVWFGTLARLGMPAAALLRRSDSRGGVSPDEPAGGLSPTGGDTTAGPGTEHSVHNDMVSTRAFLCLLRACSRSRSVSPAARASCLQATKCLAAFAVQVVGAEPTALEVGGVRVLVTGAGQARRARGRAGSGGRGSAGLVVASDASHPTAHS